MPAIRERERLSGRNTANRRRTRFGPAPFVVSPLLDGALDAPFASAGERPNVQARSGFTQPSPALGRTRPSGVATIPRPTSLPGEGRADQPPAAAVMFDARNTTSVRLLALSLRIMARTCTLTVLSRIESS